MGKALEGVRVRQAAAFTDAVTSFIHDSAPVYPGGHRGTLAKLRLKPTAQKRWVGSASLGQCRFAPLRGARHLLRPAKNLLQSSR